MSHIRTQIVAALQATLTGLTSTETRVYAGRALPLPNSPLPALLVYADDETVEPMRVATAWPQTLNRRLDVRIDALAEDDGTLDADLQAILAEVETAINASAAAATCGGVVPDALILTEINVERDADAERTIGRLNTRWTGTYYTAANAPETAL